MAEKWKPTREQVLAAYGRKMPDVIAPELKILFCGINPSLYSAAVGHHFARPGNRFWPALYQAGFTSELLSPFEDRKLIDRGYGITNVVGRATATAAELEERELIEGGKLLVKKVRRYKPKVLAVLGVSAYRVAFQRKDAVLGKQKVSFSETEIWVLPNPSGLNAHYKLDELAKIYKELRLNVEGTY